jgi:hypothetical protein
MIRKKALALLAGAVCLFAIRAVVVGQETATQPPPIESMADLEALFAEEPSYNEIQDSAMRFSEVHPDKIAAWRRGASLRAFLPEVTFRYNSSTQDGTTGYETFEWSEAVETSSSSGRETSTSTENKEEYGEEWSTAAPSWSTRDTYSRSSGDVTSTSHGSSEGEGEGTTFQTEDESGDDTGWGFFFRWDLKEFIYSQEQTKISKEARDLSELRQDVLEQVNTYFFDRRRAQIEMIFSPPSDARSKIDVQLRIARLTANIDALTGGFLSARLAKNATAK